MQQQSKREPINPANKYRAESTQRNSHKKFEKTRNPSQLIRSEARRVVRADAGKKARMPMPAGENATQNFTPYERAAELMVRLGVISIVISLIALHFHQFELTLSTLLKTLF